MLARVTLTGTAYGRVLGLSSAKLGVATDYQQVLEPRGTWQFKALVVDSLLVSVGSTKASAWTCYATGLGSGGSARSYSIIDAKLFALRRCERNSPLPVCTILWCRP